MGLHLLKLCVGVPSVEALAARRPPTGPAWRISTRQTPKRSAELLGGGSLFWVFKGHILCRQRILAFEASDAAGRQMCDILLHPDLVRVEPAPRKPFQGWRYLAADEAPRDLEAGTAAELPPHLIRELREIGAW